MLRDKAYILQGCKLVLENLFYLDQDSVVMKIDRGNLGVTVAARWKEGWLELEVYGLPRGYDDGDNSRHNGTLRIESSVEGEGSRGRRREAGGDGVSGLSDNSMGRTPDSDREEGSTRPITSGGRRRTAAKKSRRNSRRKRGGNPNQGGDNASRDKNIDGAVQAES